MHIRETSRIQRGDVITLAVDGQTVDSNVDKSRFIGGEYIVWDGESKSIKRDVAVHVE